MQLLVATRNSHKTGEIAAMLGEGWAVEDLSSLPDVPAPEETGSTFQENAEIKALACLPRFSGLVLADDSGLEVDALAGEPGVRSARYAGDEATDEENRRLLSLRLMSLDAKRSHWPARFRCALALSRGGSIIARCDGAVEGSIVTDERGSGGFGYDPLFIPQGYDQTFAELPATVKNGLSHRARALAQLMRIFETEQDRKTAGKTSNLEDSL